MFQFYFRAEKQYITLPKNIEDAKNLGKVLSRYKDKYYSLVLGGYFITYILYPFIVIENIQCVNTCDMSL